MQQVRFSLRPLIACSRRWRFDKQSIQNSATNRPIYCVAITIGRFAKRNLLSWRSAGTAPGLALVAFVKGMESIAQPKYVPNIGKNLSDVLARLLHTFSLYVFSDTVDKQMDQSTRGLLYAALKNDAQRLKR